VYFYFFPFPVTFPSHYSFLIIAAEKHHLRSSTLRCFLQCQVTFSLCSSHISLSIQPTSCLHIRPFSKI